MADLRTAFESLLNKNINKKTSVKNKPIIIPTLLYAFNNVGYLEFVDQDNKNIKIPLELYNMIIKDVGIINVRDEIYPNGNIIFVAKFHDQKYFINDQIITVNFTKLKY